MALFEPGLVYPHDGLGTYTEVSGEVIKVQGFDGDDFTSVVVQTEHGPISAWTKSKYAPKVGYNAVIRVYREPVSDNIIASWSAPLPPCEACGATEGVAYEDARTAYEVPEPTFWDKVRGEDPDLPNQPIPLCRPCAVEHHANWDAAWQEYRSGLL